MSLPPETEDALVALLAVRDGLVAEAVVQKLLLKSDGSKRLARLLVENGKLSIDDRQALLARLDPEVVPGYRIEAEAGRGGMGVVYRARQISMDRPVALKVLSRSCSEDAEFVERFIAEARSAARLNHEHVVAAIDAGTANGLHYFVMEFVDGISVADVLDDKPLPPERAWEIAEQVAHALDHAHGKAIVHRDVKPENIMLTEDGRAKLCDLGLARPAQVAGTGEKSDTTEGTPYYCSPEQALGRTDIDATSDVYSLGMTIYHMLKGEPAFDGDTAREILLQHVRDPFPKLKKVLPELTPHQRGLIEAMVVKDRAKRLPSMRAFLERLAQGEAEVDAATAEGEPGGKAPLAAIALVVAVMVVGAIALAFLGGEPDPDGPDRAGASPSPSASEVADVSPSPSRTPRGVQRVTPPPSPTPRDTGTPVDPREAEAEQALRGADRVRERSPDDRAAYRTALQHVADTYGDTGAGSQARDRLLELQRGRKREALNAFTLVAEETTELLKQQRYRDATELVDTYATQWAASLGDAASRLDELRTLVTDAAARQWTTVDASLAGKPASEALQTIDAFRAQTPPGLLPTVDAKRAEVEAKLAASAAETAFAELTTRRDELLASGDLSSAQRLLDEAVDREALAPVAAAVTAARDELRLTATAWEAFDASVRALLERDDPRTKLQLAQGIEVKGRVLEYDPTGWRLRIKPYGEHDARGLNLRDLHPEQLLAMVLPPAQGQANTLYFLARRAPAAARAAWQAWSGGGEARAALGARITALENRATELAAADRLAALLDPQRTPAEVVDGVRGLDAEVCATQAYADVHAELVAAFTKAREAQLQAQPGALFRGELSERRGEHKLEYDFDEPEHAADFTATDTVDNGEAKWDDKALLLRGKVRHRAQWAGGELKVEVKVATSSDERPNVNLILSEREAWRGQLLGLGFQYGGLSRITVSGQAPQKPGYKVSLPSNVFLTLGGHAPRGNDPWMAAENDPELIGTAGKSWRVRVERSDEGEVRLRAGASRVYTLPTQGDWDVAGRVAFLPGQTQLRITSLEIEGHLDPAWLATEAKQRAAAEAAELPKPKSS